jgi:hypothetical protein
VSIAIDRVRLAADAVPSIIAFMIIRALLFLTLLLTVVGGPSAFAVETVDWEDLVPPLKREPYPKLEISGDLHRHLLNLRMVHNLRSRGRGNERLDKVAAVAEQELRAAGIDVDAVIEPMDAYNREREANKNRLVEELNGKNIEIAGYLLPTEFRGDRVAEFLLVPSDGACVHTPVPPPNQLIYVKPSAAFKSDKPFMPVVVSGVIRIETNIRSVGYSDGSNEVRSGYSMSAARVRAYRK